MPLHLFGQLDDEESVFIILIRAMVGEKSWAAVFVSLNVEGLQFL